MSDKILIISAVYEETAHIIRHIHKERIIEKYNLLIYEGKIYGRPVDILVTGPGILNSVHALTLYLENSTQPGLIIQTGCAGGFTENNVATGDIGLASKETYIHLGVETPEKIPPSPLPFSLSKTEKIFNDFSTDGNYTEKAFKILGDKNRFRAGIYPFITVSEITSTREKSSLLYQTYRSGMENMEGAGSAYIASLYEIPFIELRSASNETGERDKKLWNLPLSFENCGTALLKIIKDIMN